MLFTTFLLATAVAAAAVLGALLARPRPAAEAGAAPVQPLRVPYGAALVLAAAVALTVLGIALL